MLIKNALIDSGSVPARRLVARFSCNLAKKSPTAVRSHGRFVINGFALRCKAGEGHVGRRGNTSGADRFRVVLSGKPPDGTRRDENLAPNSAWTDAQS